MSLALEKTVVFLLVFAMVKIATCQRERSTCSNTYCTRGRMCTEARGSTICQCPISCPNSNEPVCSVYGIEFQSRCHLHKFACEQMDINIAMKNQGPCEDSAVNPRCDRYNVVQFPHRYLDWILIARKQFLNPRLRVVLNVRGDELSPSKVREVLEWEFTNVDRNSDGRLDQNESGEIERELLSIQEGCAQGFLKSCDKNSNGAISLDEWLDCFPRGVVRNP